LAAPWVTRDTLRRARVRHEQVTAHNNGEMIVTGTADGVYEVSLDGTIQRHALSGMDIGGVSGDWAITANAAVSLSSGQPVALPDGLQPRCVLGGAGGSGLVGTSAARLFEVTNQGARAITSFDTIESRREWSTPWGGPPDTRSMARSSQGLLVNVHVGGVWRGDGHSWAEVVEADQDAHQVVAHENVVAVAGATGVGQSNDGGRTWHWSSEGLHASYCRAVTLAEGWLLASASTGPGTREGTIYRRPLDKPEADFVPCGGSGDLPESFPYNVDTFELAAEGELVALGTPSGQVFLSDDAGAHWRLLVDALPGVRSVTFAE
jgi:hypothetical protein